MLLRFTKMHGLGNDFMLVDLISQNARLREDQIRALADRRTGIGFDQLLLVEPPQNPEMDFRYRIFNADGTEAEQCGNGARCFARFVRDRGLTAKTEIRLETNTGDITVKLEKDGNLTVNMGAPRLAPEQIPFVAPGPMIQHEVELRPLPACGSLPDRVCLTVVNVGNPHAVVSTRDVETAPVTTLAPLIQDSGRFPEGVNVGFMEVVSRNEINLRVFERGVGETRACGTGACAAVVAGRLQGKLDETVLVNLPGGALSVTWPGDNADIQMTGGASRVYEGRLQI